MQQRCVRPGTTVSRTVFTRHDKLVLTPLDTAPACARHAAKAVLQRWGLLTVSDEVEVIISELVTNAVQHATYPPEWPIVVWLHGSRHSLLIQVWDGILSEPHLATPTDDTEGGRGLFLVDQLSSQWGFGPWKGGKVVWARIDFK